MAFFNSFAAVIQKQMCVSISFVLTVFLNVTEAQPPLKDKSSWRKSNLNVPNTSEETELEVRRLRRMRSRGNMDSSSTSNTLQVKFIMIK